MSASALFADSADVAHACRDHPFVQGIASGRLPRAAFAFYVAQDAAFLDAFVRAYALALAKSPDRASMLAFKRLLDGALEELALHAGYAARWHVELDAVPAAATRAYTDFLLRVAALEPSGHTAAAMAPCMRLYAWLGAELLPITAPDSPYREWVDAYASSEFAALADALDTLVERLAQDHEVARTHYRQAMELELAFFAAAWERGRPTVTQPRDEDV